MPAFFFAPHRLAKSPDPHVPFTCRMASGSVCALEAHPP